MQYKAKSISALHIALGGLPGKMRVEADPDLGVSATTVGELRKVTVCIMTNARSSFGGYTGLKGNVFPFSGKKVVDIIEPQSQDCHGPMTAWPEFNGRSRCSNAAVPANA